MLAIVLEIVPLLDITSDFFVRSVTYENNLFVGIVDKSQHENIIRAYYGRFSKINPTWKIIKQLVADMFTNKKVEGRKIGFYGSNGFCLFNYFVRSQNPQKWFVGFVTLLNFTCVLIIAICYIAVGVSVSKSSGVVGTTNKLIINRNKIIQRKVSILITTDVLSWVPFMAVVMIHFAQLVDASNWYSVFSIIVIPCNSIINPILILEDTFKRAVQVAWRAGAKICSCGHISNESKEDLEMVQVRNNPIHD